MLTQCCPTPESHPTPSSAPVGCWEVMHSPPPASAHLHRLRNGEDTGPDLSEGTGQSRKSFRWGSLGHTHSGRRLKKGFQGRCLLVKIG